MKPFDKLGVFYCHPLDNLLGYVLQGANPSVHPKAIAMVVLFF